MSNRPRLSIVIPSHSRSDLLELCLNSLSRFAPDDSEILVVDDGSKDGVVSRVASTFPRISIIRFPKSQGFCHAANRGIEATTGEIVELLNDDTQVSEGWAEAALRAFDDDRIGAVAPLVLMGPNDQSITRIDSAGDDYDRGGFARKRGHGQPLSDSFLHRRFVAAASGSSAFYRRETLEQVGLFEESFGAYFEDVDLSCRIRRHGWEILFEPDSRVWHRVGSSYAKRSRHVIEMQSRNEERLFWRNASGFGSIIRHAGVLMGKSILRLREGSFGPFMMGRLRAVLQS